MRQIKFRGITKAHPRRWVYGDILQHSDGICIFDHSVSLITSDGVYLGTTVIPETVGQATGLKDSNGKEIWEGDMVIATLHGMITEHIKSAVEYSDGYWGIRAIEDGALVDSAGKFKSFEGCITTESIEVIGTIHDKEVQP